MPSIYLSPSLQEFNQYIIGGNEEYYMNLIADAMVPYLRAMGIDFTRNNPNDTLSAVIAQSNAGNYDLHLALHSNASPEAIAGTYQGPEVYYYTTSLEGERAAQIIANNLKLIYPNPDLIMVVPTTALAELRQVIAPSVLVEIAYHDNYEDALWIANNIDLIARNLSLSLADYFGIPFIEPFG
ncbi:MAG: N-acetylmuramoyl-L-alanine amidase family protein [Anaerovoracaceae bacterium]|jgi:N-acetylmuramoyl-L-alanine amidase